MVFRRLRIFSSLSFAMCAVIFSAVFFPTQTRAVTLQKSQLNTNSNLRNGLIGYWPLDGADVTDKVYDRSGQGHNGGWYGTGAGTITSTTSAKAGGKIGQGLNFDGTDDRVDTGADIIGLGDVTTCIWAKANPITDNRWAGMFDSVYYQLQYYFTGGNYYISVTNNNNTSLLYQLPTSPVGVWNHICVVRVSSGTATIYLNGSSVASGSAGTPNTFYNLNLGGHTVSGYYFPGVLDEARVYNRLLSATEIKQIYNLGQGIRQKNLESRNTGLQNGLIGYWTLDGADVTTKVFDRSGSGNHGGYNGGSTTSAKVGGKIGQALNFDGTANTIGAAVGIIGAGANSSCAWIYPRSVASFKAIISNTKFDLEIASASTAGKMTFTSDGGTTAVSGDDSVLVNRWQHVCVTRDAAGVANFYVNATLSGTPNQNSGTPAGTAFSTYIGAYGTGGQGFFNGYIDDVRIYNRVLSATEIQQLYNLGQTVAQKNLESKNTGLKSGLVGYWTFDGPDVTTKVFDRSGSGNNGGWYGTAAGTITSTTSAKTWGKIGQALAFDGTDDHVDVSASLSSDVSASAWIKVNTTVTDSPIVGGSGILSFFQVYSGLGTLAVYDGTDYHFSSTVLKPGVWYHVTLTFTGSTKEISLYVNGVREYNGVGVGTYTNGQISQIGSNGSYKMNGTIDDVHLYNRALSTTEVKQLYNVGR